MSLIIGGTILGISSLIGGSMYYYYYGQESIAEKVETIDMKPLKLLKEGDLVSDLQNFDKSKLKKVDVDSKSKTVKSKITNPIDEMKLKFSHKKTD